MEGIIHTAQTSGTVVPYGTKDFFIQDFIDLTDHFASQLQPEYISYTSRKAKTRIYRELKRWWRWENGCPTSMDIFIYRYDGKSRRMYKSKLKNKHKYSRK